MSSRHYAGLPLSQHIGTTVHPDLISSPEPTIRVWLYLVVNASKKPALTTTAREIAGMLSGMTRPTSCRAASRAIRQLEELDLINVRRIGNAMEISMLSTAGCAGEGCDDPKQPDLFDSFKDEGL